MTISQYSNGKSESVSRQLRRQPTTENGNIAVSALNSPFMVIRRCRNHLLITELALVVIKKTAFCRLNFDALCHISIFKLSRMVGSESLGIQALDIPAKPKSNVKWPFKVVQGHLFLNQ